MKGQKNAPAARVLAAGKVSPGLFSELHRHPELPSPPRYSFAIGDRIGPDLTVIGYLAAGRWSEIYQVWSAGGWCSFACKILSPRFAHDRTARASLRREHLILRRLRHPNVIRVFGAGEHNSLSYLLLDYIGGPSLLDLLDSLPERRMPIPDAVRAVIYAGSGLAHLHRCGFLHLDLKPANLLLREGIPVLVDMDAARPLSPSRALRSSPGTMPYMAPEQVLRLPLNLSADVYGLGTILYELLTGRWPFEGVYDGEDTRVGLEKKYPQIGPTPPPFTRTFRPEIPQAIDRLVLRALARDPRDRFATVPEFLHALASELDDPVSLARKHLTQRGCQPKNPSCPSLGKGGKKAH